VTDLTWEDRAVVLVDRLSQLDERLAQDRPVGEAFSSAALLTLRKVEGHERLVATKFLSAAP